MKRHPNCENCKKRLKPKERRGGPVKRFCGPKCRYEYWNRMNPRVYATEKDAFGNLIEKEKEKVS